MYPGTACNRDIPTRETKPLHFREIEDEKNIANPSLTIPAVNISETTAAYMMVMAVPGLHRDDFSIEINQSVITIAAKKETVPLTCVNDRCEYDYTEWTRAFSLPADADAVLANAGYQNGELTILIPRNNTDENQAKATIYVY
jgi:HSP20 family protein